MGDGAVIQHDKCGMRVNNALRRFLNNDGNFATAGSLKYLCHTLYRDSHYLRRKQSDRCRIIK